MKRQISLAASVAWITALVIATAMLIYAVFQYVSVPDMTFWQLLVTHSWHVLALGGLTYVALHVLLHKQMIEPLQMLYIKLYAVARGDNERITVKTNIREIQDMASSINLMLEQLQRTSHEPWVNKLRTSGDVLRAMSEHATDTLNASETNMLARTAAELDELAMALEQFEARFQNLGDSPIQEERSLQ